MRQRFCGEGGVMLLEAILYMVLSVMLLACIFSILSFGLLAWRDSTQQLAAQQAARMSLDSMVRELREAVKLEYDAENPAKIAYIEPVQHKKVCFYEKSGVLYRDSDLIPQPIAGVKNEFRVKRLVFAVAPDLQVVDIDLTFCWYARNNEEKTASITSTVYCINCRQEN